MRTDSVTLSKQAFGLAVQQVETEFGEAYLSDRARNSNREAGSGAGRPDQTQPSPPKASGEEQAMFAQVSKTASRWRTP